MFRAVQPLFSANANRRSSRTLDVGAHLDQKLREVGNFRFERRIFDVSVAFGKRSSHENIFRSRDSNLIEDHAPAA